MNSDIPGSAVDGLSLIHRVVCAGPHPPGPLLPLLQEQGELPQWQARCLRSQTTTQLLPDYLLEVHKPQATAPKAPLVRVQSATAGFVIVARALTRRAGRGYHT